MEKFHNKEGHFILILTPCQVFGNEINLKSKSPIYKNIDILSKKLNCFQNIFKRIKKDDINERKRLQNFSSTFKTNENCYLEIISKISHILYSYKGLNISNKNKYKRILNRLNYYYDNIKSFNIKEIINYIKLFPDVKHNNKHYYKKGAEELRQQRYEKKKQIYNLNNNQEILKQNTINLSYLFNNNGGSQFIKIKGYGRRKIRYQKNGRAYVIVNKKKLKL